VTSKYKPLVPELELKPCPYCGGKDIRFSIKTTTIYYERAYHFTMYCWDCNCYGPRVLHKCGRHIYNRSELEKSVDFYTQAAEAWNRRVTND
jgi:hypothetical protein